MRGAPRKKFVSFSSVDENKNTSLGTAGGAEILFWGLDSSQHMNLSPDMFIKCLCSHYWEQLLSDGLVSSISRIKLEPVYLPVTSYLVEDSLGRTQESIIARYSQARRHMQGVAELSYIVLQHYSIVSESGEKLPWRVHFQFFRMMFKYVTAMIVVTFHSGVLSVMLGVSIFFLVKHVAMGDIWPWLLAARATALNHPVIGFFLHMSQFFGPLMGAIVFYTNFLIILGENSVAKSIQKTTFCKKNFCYTSALVFSHWISPRRPTPPVPPTHPSHPLHHYLHPLSSLSLTFPVGT